MKKNDIVFQEALFLKGLPDYESTLVQVVAWLNYLY